MKRKDEDRVPTDGGRSLGHNPFGQLSALRDALPAGEAPKDDSSALKGNSSAPKRDSSALKGDSSALKSDSSTPKPGSSALEPGPARAVVRMERKGRGGKEVTVVEQLGLPARELDAWLKALKGALGCGGAVEDGALVLQGDHRERVRDLLVKRGVRKVSIG